MKMERRVPPRREENEAVELDDAEPSEFRIGSGCESGETVGSAAGCLPWNRAQDERGEVFAPMKGPFRPRQKRRRLSGADRSAPMKGQMEAASGLIRGAVLESASEKPIGSRARPTARFLPSVKLFFSVIETFSRDVSFFFPFFFVYLQFLFIRKRTSLERLFVRKIRL